MKKYMVNAASLVALVLTFSSAALAGPSFTVVDLNQDPRWDVTYLGSSYDGEANTTSFSYLVSVNDDPALSHFTVGLPICDNLIVSSYSPDNLVSIGLDPTTGIYGIKWDEGQGVGTTEVYTLTISGEVLEGQISLAVKAGLFAAIATMTGPSCETVVSHDTFSISGTTYLDSNGNGILDPEEALLANVTVAIYNNDFELIGTTITDTNGFYTFTDLVEGSYRVVIVGETPEEDINEILDAYFTATSALIREVELTEDVTGQDFGFLPDNGAILQDLNPMDPDGDGFTLPGEGRTIGFWKHQLTVAIKGKGKAQIGAASLLGYLYQIEAYFLAEPFDFGGSFEAAFAVLSSTSSVPVDLLKKQLLATEFNEMSGYGLASPYRILQGLVLMHAEYVAANPGSFTSAGILEVKDVLDWINNLGE